MIRVIFPKKERNTYKFSPLANTLLLYVYISDKMWDLFFNQVTKRLVLIRRQRLFETLRKLKHKQYIILVLPQCSFKTLEWILHRNSTCWEQINAHLLQILNIVKKDFHINACNASSQNLRCFSKHDFLGKIRQHYILSLSPCPCKIFEKTILQ